MTFYITMLLLWFSHFVVDFMIGIWPVYKTIAHLDLATCGMIAGLCALIGEGMQIVFGSLSDRGYRKALIVIGLCGTLAGTCMVFTENYVTLFFLLMILCIGSGAFHPSAVGLVGSLTTTRKGVFIAIFSSGGALGMASSQLVFSEAYRVFDGNTLYLAILPLVLIIGIIFYKLAGTQPIPAISTRKKIDLKEFFGLFRRREITLLYFIQVCNQTIVWATVFLLPDVLLSRGHETWVTFGGGHLFFIIGGALMMIPSGYLADKFSYKTVIFTATFLAFILFSTFLFVPNISTSGVLGLLFVMGATAQVVSPLLLAFGNKLVPNNPGMISALLMGLAWCLSEGLGQGGGGALTQLFEVDAAANALCILNVCFLIGLGLTSMLPKEVKNSESSTIETNPIVLVAESGHDPVV